jgi:hypothetical protein
MRILPTLEDIDSEHKIYSAHLANGGKPIQIILTLRPGDGTLDWDLHGEVPSDLPRLIWIPMFASYSREQIEKALQPPTKEETK